MDIRDRGQGYIVSGCVPTAQGAGTFQINVSAGSFVSNSGAFTAFAGGNVTPGPLVNPNASRCDLVYFTAAGALALAAGVEVVVSPNTPAIPPVTPAGGTPDALAYITPGAVDYTVATSAFLEDIRQYNAPPALPDGTVAAPSLFFGNEPGTGLYRPGPGRIGVAIAGGEQIEFGTTYIALGTNPAAGGAIRLQNTNYVLSRNAANTADLTVIGVDASNRIWIDANASGTLIGGTATVSGAFLSVGTNPAAAGLIRLPSSWAAQARNAANTADMSVIGVNGSDVIAIAFTGQQVTISGNIVAPVSFMSLGGTPALTGDIRLRSQGYIVGRNTTNTGDVQLIGSDSGDAPAVGDPNFTLKLVSSVAVDFRYPATALGGGVVPTLGTIGGAGPATAAQNSWLRIKTNNVDAWIPLWR